MVPRKNHKYIAKVRTKNGKIKYIYKNASRMIERGIDEAGNDIERAYQDTSKRIKTAPKIIKKGVNDADTRAGKFYHDKIMRGPDDEYQHHTFGKDGRTYLNTYTAKKSKNARKLSDYAKGALGISRNKYERRYKAAKKAYTPGSENYNYYTMGKHGKTVLVDRKKELEKAKRDLDRYNRRKGYNTRWVLSKRELAKRHSLD